MNKQYVLIVIILLLVAVIAHFFIPGPKDSLSLTVETYTEKNDAGDIHAEYPQFPGVSKEFNKKIYDAVFGEITDFKKTAQENNNLRRKNGGPIVPGNVLYLRVGWSPDQLNNNIVSIIIRTSSYTGGAHGAHTLLTFTYDIQNKKEMTLDSLFGTVPGYLDRISQFSGNDLKSQMGKDANMDMIAAGTAPKPENFSKFTLGTENTVTFYFGDYQVAPYVYGESKVVMPISYLKQVL